MLYTIQDPCNTFDIMSIDPLDSPDIMHGVPNDFGDILLEMTNYEKAEEVEEEENSNDDDFFTRGLSSSMYRRSTDFGRIGLKSTYSKGPGHSLLNQEEDDVEI